MEAKNVQSLVLDIVNLPESDSGTQLPPKKSILGVIKFVAFACPVLYALVAHCTHTHCGHYMRRARRWSSVLSYVLWTSCKGSARMQRPGMLLHERRARRQKRSGVSSCMVRTLCVGRAT